MKTKERARKILTVAASLAAAAAVLFGGTFAWQSISQKAMNKAERYANPGARLHDDFNGENKDVYVENFTNPDDNGVPVYARIRLDEYMEIGKGAGDINAAERNVTVIGKADAKLDDPDTWITHIPNGLPNTGDTPIHKYWKWDMGGKTVFMPTFNKDRDNLIADINGTFEGPDGDVKTDNDRYQDYVEYTLGEQKTDTAKYAGGVTAQETHEAKETGIAEVLTMAEWKAKGSPIGKYWVYDTDGWAYWAEAIQPGESTGLLLNGIAPDQEPDDSSYYAINVIGQFATAGDWGDKDTGTGFYEDGISTDGLFVLNNAAGRLPKIVHIQPKNGEYTQYVKAGSALTLEADVNVEYGTGAAAETYVHWSVEPETSALQGNQFVPEENMIGKSYRVTATSAYDANFNTTIEVYVYPKDAVGVVDGELDGKRYIDYGDNTYKMINDDGTLSNFVCAGKDEKIGNFDDKTNVVELDQMDPNFGSKFIGPDGYGYYYAVGGDNKLGTDDDIRVMGDPWPNNITDRLVDSVEVTLIDNNTGKISPGSRGRLSAVVKRGTAEVHNQNVKWSIIGNKDANTKIDVNGNIYMGIGETIGSVITVTAESELQAGVTGRINIEVDKLGYDSLGNISPGTTTTVTIDDIEWYILAKDGNKALLWSKSTVGPNKSLSPARWQNSTTRTYLNEELIETLTFLKDKIAETNLTTRSQFNVNDWDTTTDKVFLLSEADVFGTHNGKSTSDARDYTYGNSMLVRSAAMRKFTGSSAYAHLRSLRDANNKVTDIIGSSGAATASNASNVYGMRPALWVIME